MREQFVLKWFNRSLRPDATLVDPSQLPSEMFRVINGRETAGYVTADSPKTILELRRDILSYLMIDVTSLLCQKWFKHSLVAV